MRTSRAAFTLIEVLIGLTLGIIILTAAASVFAFSVNRAEQARVRAELARDASFAARLISTELRQAGSGVPTGVHIQQDCAGPVCVPTYGTTRPAEFAGGVIRAEPTQVGIVGDVPFHNSNFPTFGLLHRRPTGRTTSIWWHNENNGLSVPGEPAAGAFFAGENTCATGSARTCPWGLGRLAAGDRIQIVAGNQNWSHAAAVSPLSVAAPLAPGVAAGLSLSFPFDFSAPTLVWPNTGYALPPMGLRGAGWVTTLDRVFFRRTGTTVERVQCVGDVDPSDPNWGAPAAFTPVSAVAPVAPNSCDAPEVIARFVDRLEFSYFADNGLVAATPANIARIDFVLVLRAPLKRGGEVLYEMRGSVRLPAA